MRLPTSTIAACLAFSVLAGCGKDDVTDVPEVPDVLGSIEVSALDGPIPVLAEGETQVVYEINVSNPVGNASVRLAELTVMAGNNVLASYAGVDLQQILSVPSLEVQPESGRLIYLWFSFAPDQVPPTLTNTLAFADTHETRNVVVDVAGPGLTAMKAPLEGAGWIAGNIGNDTGHRRAIYKPEGEDPRLAQRFAVDWVQTDDAGNLYVGDPFVNENHHAYGQPVLAVADGRVAAVKDGIPENVPGSLAVEITLETLGGNSVALELGDGTGAYYGHLIPGSIRVSPGDMVQVGDTLGLLGNSGNSDLPHLHVHFVRVFDWETAVADGQGLPFVFDSFEIIFNERPVLGMRSREMPLNDAILRFN